MEVFVVIGSCGEWEDHSEWVELVTYSAAKAQRHIDARLAKFKADEDAYERVSAWRSQYMDANPYPELDRSRWKERKRWPPGLRHDQITPEMRAEREAVATHNQVLSDEHKIQLEIWQAAKDKACMEFIAAEFSADEAEQERLFDLRYREPLSFNIEKHPIDEPEQI